jgi:enamine deaminase RidA (YjgF/YER057c/UK114 family)
VTRLRITRRNPPGLHPTGGYHHVTIVESGRVAHLAGQCPLDADEQVVGPGDYDAQVDQVAANALVALADAGATPSDVVRSVVYVVSADSAVLARAWHRFAERSPLASAFQTASTLVGVSALGYAGQLVELDLTASLPD